MNYMRNTQTGELRTVEADSPEFAELKLQVAPDGKTPLWEQTGQHHAEAVVARADAGELLDTDLGFEHKDRPGVLFSTAGVGSEKAPWENLTPAEVESGLSPESKAKELSDDYATSPDTVLQYKQEVADKISANAAEVVSDDGEPVSEGPAGSGATSEQLAAAQAEADEANS